jgi:hypothetical protein
MKRELVLLLVALAIAAVWAAPQNPPTPPPQRPAQPAQPARDRARSSAGTAAIRGRVFAADTDTPLRRARITWSLEGATTSGAGSQGPAGVMTDNNGRFEIQDLAPGRYHVFARRSGFLQMAFASRRGIGEIGRAVADADRGITIDLADGQAFEAANFHLAREGVIAGHIVDEYGDPVVSAFVGAGRMGSAGGRRRLIGYATDTTDDQGEYRLFGLPPGSYYVVASAPAYLRQTTEGSSYADVLYPGVTRRDQARPVAVRLGEEVAEINFALAPVRLARIEGTILTSRGTVPRGGSFALTRRSDAGIEQTTTYGASWKQDDGAFSISRVLQGACDLVATVTADGGTTEVAVQHLMVGNDDISGLMIVTGPEGRLTGTVRTDTGGPLPATGAPGLPATSMRVTATSPEDGSDGVFNPSFAVSAGQPRPGAVNSGGSFTASVRPGARLISVAGLPLGWGVAAVLSGDRTITDSPVDVPPGTSFPVQIIVSNRLPEIAGSAVDDTGKPTWDYTVVVFPKDASRTFAGSPLIRSERPNQRGEFRIERLPPGDYNIAAVQEGDDVDWSEPDALEKLRPLSAEVRIGLGDKKTVELKVVRPGT